MRALAALSRFVGNTFAYWVLLFAILAFLFPQVFIGLKGWIVPLLGLVMFGMGLTLKLEDFSEVARNPWRVALGVIAHFVIMPGVAWLLCQVFQLPPEIAVGVILVGCCPSGTSSNVMAWLAKGDLALAVAIAAVTTLLAPLLTPTLIWLLASAWLPVSFLDMFWSILQLVMLPIVLGVVAQRLLGARVSYAMDVLPLVSVVSIVMIVCAVVAASQAKIAESGLLIMAVVILHNTFGFLLGYFTGKVFSCHWRNASRWHWKSACRTPAWARHWPARTFRHWRRCRVRCSASGTIFPVRCWRRISGKCRRKRIHPGPSSDPEDYRSHSAW
ncbi:Sodium/bile acid symporter protein [Pseudomonas cannabina]|uniref:Sodium/bile acid symporter family protein n=1 Tax=Pseudomonas cannabina TaxID=86840 RepID=A0A0P9KIC1_PSECA|nr:Sodium/bile acid symporter family protein [Pseudomonas cannabina]RMN18448.1 Sodium/bile acid symporter protein [Pseudomonas cannabina]SDQ62641.1 bile acid:Na+ symporter, BASS family [Pseudomonas cannabina]